MTRGEMPSDLIKDFVETKPGIWEHKLLSDYKVELYNSKYRVWHKEDVVYSSMFLDRALRWAADELARRLYMRKIGG